MTRASLVPLPAHVEVREGAQPFALMATTRADALREAGAILETTTVPDVRLGTEGYRLEVDATGARAEAATEAGLFYARQTLGQLVTRTEAGWAVAAASLVDLPRFGYRGVMLDVARHFFPVAVVKAYIDRAAALKFNALHLHLTDDQGWRLHIEAWPRLTEVAAGASVGGDPGGFYTEADYAEIVGHAAARHMIVVPEIDVPGHTHAVGLAYPELAEDPVLSEAILAVVREHGGGVPTRGEAYTGMAVGFSSLRLRDERTYRFLRDVFADVAERTPGPYVHLGGDEALGTSPEDFAYAIARVATIVAETGKIPIAWHEAGAAGDLPAGTIGQYWGFVTPTDGHDVAARAFVAGGGHIILSPADAVYLDMKHNADDALGLTWANGPTSVERAYSWEPVDVVEGIAEDAILGVEAPLWTETIRTLADIDAMAFPRIAAAAEIAWSAAPSSDAAAGMFGERTWESFRTRVGGLGPLWTQLGIGYSRAAEIPWSPA